MRNRHQAPLAAIVQQPFDVPLLVRPSDQAEMRLKQKVPDQSLELGHLFPLPTPHDLRCGHFRVVIADPLRYAVEKPEGPLMAFEKDFSPEWH